uniref:Selenoprotein O n=2 Tax=Ciona intestinalis TaxID=7719 RepID=F7AHM4_CIOIN
MLGKCFGSKLSFFCRNFKTASAMATIKQPEDLQFDNLALKTLPVDESKVPGSRQVRGACFSLTDPTPLENPKLVAFSESALRLLDLKCNPDTEAKFSEYFCGNKLLPGSVTASHCYCGHQFGYFSGQLGDGAAIYLGEVINSKGDRWEIQLKGAGQTPYSRSADGRKVLRSTIREFLCSEAIFHLGIPTTRAGTVVVSDDKVVRDMFYDGKAKLENCAVVLRLAPSFLRFGSFEIFKPIDPATGRGGPSTGMTGILPTMLQYALDNFFKEVDQALPKVEQYLAMYKEVCVRTAALVAKWQCVGFCHGVLNTDNMSLLGLTIDYGPFGFMDRFDPNFQCNNSDNKGRYVYKAQPEICQWNLKKFAEAIQECLPLNDSLKVLEESYFPEYKQQYLSEMRKKLGLVKNLPEDEALVDSFLNTMEETYADFTNSFRSLSVVSLPGVQDHEPSIETTLGLLLKDCSSLESVKLFTKSGFTRDQIESLKQVAEQNPAFLSMIGASVQAIEDEVRKMDAFDKIQTLSEEDLLKSNKEKWQSWLKKYCSRLKKEITLQQNLQVLDGQRKQLMNSINPKYILRNYIAENAIKKAENGDFSEVRKVLQMLENPFHDETVQPDEVTGRCGSVDYNAPPPLSALSLKVS